MAARSPSWAMPQARRAPAAAARAVLVDSSAVEVYANGGRMVFSTRWFPTDPQLSVRVSGNAQDIRLYPMGRE